MNTRTLGNTNFTISEIGLGCWQFGGDFGDITEDTALSILDTAIQNDVTFIDTANVYGDGRSERIIGQFLKACSQPLTIVTKTGRESQTYPDKYSKDNLLRSIEGSRERLGVDSLDLLQLHCVPPEVLKAGAIFDWLRDFKSQGLIKNFGASVETVDEGLLCMEQEGMATLQIIFNIFRQKPVTELLPVAQSNNVGIIVRLPLASGLLSGKFTHDTTFASNDHRNFNRDGQMFNVGETFAGLPFDTGVDIANEIKNLLPEGMTMIELALRWILDHEAVSVIIPGATSPDQAAANAATSALPPLPPDLHKALSDLYQNQIHDQIRGPY
ncbi:MAG: aldo/keto reductase [Verrucomicrobiota bacterium]